MASCNFSIPFQGAPEQIMQTAKSAIENKGGTFNGDASEGTFSVKVFGNIKGSYTIAEQAINVNIESKPIFISCSQIESFMKSNIGK